MVSSAVVAVAMTSCVAPAPPPTSTTTTAPSPRIRVLVDKRVPACPKPIGPDSYPSWPVQIWSADTIHIDRATVSWSPEPLTFYPYAADVLANQWSDAWPPEPAPDITPGVTIVYTTVSDGVQHTVTDFTYGVGCPVAG